VLQGNLNLLLTPLKYESLRCTKEAKTNGTSAKEIMIRLGIITVPNKRLSGSQHRKYHLITKELEKRGKKA
jgi:hypothetical protein